MIEKYEWDMKNDVPMTDAQREKIYDENREKSFMHTLEHMGEIYETFYTQMRKVGHKDREVAIEEIVNYLVKDRYDAYKATGDKSQILDHWSDAECLRVVANIIEAANSGDKEAVKGAYKDIDWSDRGPHFAWNAIKFSYWIMCDEDRKKYEGVIKDYLRGFVKDEVELQEIISRFENLSDLENLKHHNKLTRETIGAPQKQ